jgi:hydroxylaminobenzene mutase
MSATGSYGVAGPQRDVRGRDWPPRSAVPRQVAAAVEEPARRHPLDPDPIPSTKAGAVLALGVVAALTGITIGGVVPATIALFLAREVRADLRGAQGFLIGNRRVRVGVVLAWTGIVLAATTIVVAIIIGLLDFAGYGRDYAPTVN